MRSQAGYAGQRPGGSIHGRISEHPPGRGQVPESDAVLL